MNKVKIVSYVNCLNNILFGGFILCSNIVVKCMLSNKIVLKSKMFATSWNRWSLNNCIALWLSTFTWTIRLPKPSSMSNLLIQSISWMVASRGMYLASVFERNTYFCFRLHQLKTASPILTQKPFLLEYVLRQTPYFESDNASIFVLPRLNTTNIPWSRVLLGCLRILFNPDQCCWLGQLTNWLNTVTTAAFSGLVAFIKFVRQPNAD